MDELGSGALLSLYHSADLVVHITVLYLPVVL